MSNIPSGQLNSMGQMSYWNPWYQPLASLVCIASLPTLTSRESRGSYWWEWKSYSKQKLVRILNISFRSWQYGVLIYTHLLPTTHLNSCHNWPDLLEVFPCLSQETQPVSSEPSSTAGEIVQRKNKMGRKIPMPPITHWMRPAPDSEKVLSF